MLNFRKALTFIKKNYPFSRAFGSANTREECINSAQATYARLMKRTPNATQLPFETIAILAVDEKGKIDHEVVQPFIKLFRPDRNGNLSMLDFVRSVDSVYKEFRLLDATIENSSQIDLAFEKMFNVGFYAIVICVTLSQLGLYVQRENVGWQRQGSLFSILIRFPFLSQQSFDALPFIKQRHSRIRLYDWVGLVQVL